MERKCRVRDWRGNPFVRHEQKIGTESPLKRPSYFDIRGVVVCCFTTKIKYLSLTKTHCNEK